MPLASPFAARYRALQQRIAAAARRAGRDPAGITLVAVSKGQPVAAIRALYALGQRDFGESRPEQLPQRAAQLPDCPEIRWHLIGPVQSRKISHLSPHTHLLHSLDRLSLAQKLAAAAPRPLPALLQFNVSGEAAKSGWLAHEEARWLALWPEIEQILDLPNLEVRGLMTLAPYAEDPEAARPHFQRLARLQAALRQRFPSAEWGSVSAGMSGDFEVAIEEGATHVRVGSALFEGP